MTVERWTRREWVAALAAAAGAPAAPLAPSAGPSRPDVLLILADQWNPRCLGYAGDRAVRTPNLDHLAAEGTVFENCYTPCPVCMPARSSLLSGRYPHNHQLRGNNTNYFLPPEIAPMFRDIRSAGWTTAQIGKLHWTGGSSWRKHFDTREAYYKELGIDHCREISTPFETPEGTGPYQEHLRRIGRLDAYCRDIAERVEKGQYWPHPSAVAPEDHNDSFVAGAAIDFLREQPAARPYSLVVSFPGPHPPMDAPGKFATLVPPGSIQLPPSVPERLVRDGETCDRDGVRKICANYYGKMALFRDENIGRLVEAVKSRGNWENTLLIFSADHGEMMGAHGFFSKGRFYEESGRVPLLMRWPGHIRRGASRALCQLFDIYPTVVDAVGGKLSAHHFARSLLPVARGEAESLRDAVFSEIGNGSYFSYMVRTPDHAWWTHRGKEALYDMRNDPYQLNNLIGSASHRGVLDEMRMRHLEYFKTTQINLSDTYRPMLERLTEEGGGKEGLAERLYQQYRRKQKLGEK